MKKIVIIKIDKNIHVLCFNSIQSISYLPSNIMRLEISFNSGSKLQLADSALKRENDSKFTDLVDRWSKFCINDELEFLIEDSKLW